jgi:hypothetical protein
MGRVSPIPSLQPLLSNNEFLSVRSATSESERDHNIKMKLEGCNLDHCSNRILFLKKLIEVADGLELSVK